MITPIIIGIVIGISVALIGWIGKGIWIYFSSKKLKSHESTKTLIKLLRDILSNIRETQDAFVNVNTKPVHSYITESIDNADRLFDDIKNIRCFRRKKLREKYKELYYPPQINGANHIQYLSHQTPQKELEIRKLIRTKMNELMALLE